MNDLQPPPLSSENYEVFAVRYGSRETTRSEVFLNHHLYGEPDGPIGMDYYFWIIRNEYRTIVVDTGFGRIGGENRHRTFLLEPRKALESLGIDPSTCTLVLTHLHYDHAGNIELFPGVDIHLTRREFDFWTGAHAHRLQFHHSVEDHDIDVLRQAHHAGRLRFVEGRKEIAPGVEMIEVGGHSPGQAILTVTTDDGLVLLASDATHYYEEIERDMPFFVVDDLTAMYAGFDLMNSIVTERNAVLVPGHDPEVLLRHEPLEGALAEHAVRILTTPHTDIRKIESP